jgi:hypothetical protein
MSKNSLEQIANLLPEGLTEGMVEKIATLVHTKIQEEVNARTEDLTVKVKAYLRGQIDRLKEQAIKELELENETFRSAQLYESVKSLFVSELTPEDEVNAVDLVTEEKKSSDHKLGVLTSEMEKVLKENSDLRRLLKVSSDKNEALSARIQEYKHNLAESRAVTTMQLSDTAEVVSKENFHRQGKKLEERKDSVKPETNGNKFLTEEVIRLMSN